MILPRFEFEAPSRLAEVCAWLAEAGDEARVLAGGTDLLLRMKRGELAPRLLLSLCRTNGLDQVETLAGGGVHIGSLATMSRLAASRALAGPWSAVAEGAAAVAGPVIRNRATVGGNIVNARPCADTVPPLMALGAQLRLESARGARTLELDGFISGPGETRRRADEILTQIELLPLGGGGTGSCYLKTTRRAAMEVTLVGCAAAVTLDESREAIQRVRIVLTSVAPVLLRVSGVESILENRVPSESAFREAADAARRAAHPIDDHRAPATYRLEVVEALTRRALHLAFQRAREATS
jgi:carbon-monoxide dehydrogenase medium subunit